jgi:multidrug resistance efflux pump
MPWLLAVAILLGGAAAGRAADDIGGTGTIEPRDGVVHISGVPGALIWTVPVHVGDLVKRGDLIMTLDDTQAKADEALAEIAVNQAKAAAALSVATQDLTVRRASDHLALAEKELRLYRDLGPDSTSQLEIDKRQAAVSDDRIDVDQARATARQLRDDGADSVRTATERLDLAKTTLANYRIVAPADGTVLKINMHAGERLIGTPAIELGDLTAIYVVCEVFQGDLLKLAPGMSATIKNSAFAHSLTGKIDSIGRVIDTKAQLGEVKIKLDDTSQSSRLVGMEVDVQVARP